MSAETLREAAAEIRADHEGVNYNVQSDFMFAVADWLEQESRVTCHADNPTRTQALTVARAYLAEQS